MNAKNLAIALLLWPAAAIICAADWPQWRGPRQDGVSHERGWAFDWGDEGPARLWEAEVGAGHAAVAVVGERLYTMGSSGDENEQDAVFCLNVSDGSIAWKHVYDRPQHGRRATKRGGGNITPTVQGDVDYAYSGDAQLFCLKAETGEVIWGRDLAKELKAQHAQYDHNASPVVVDELVIVTVRLPDASIIAFDKRMGKEVLAGGRIYCRNGDGALVCLDVRGSRDRN